MTQEAKQVVTRQEALEWLAALERPCTDCTAKDGVPCNCLACHGTGRLPVLDLREPCPCLTASEKIIDQGHFKAVGGCENCWSRWFSRVEYHKSCQSCGGTTWIPKQGPTEVQDAMVQDGWVINLTRMDGYKRVRFHHRAWRFVGTSENDEAIAAYKAMKEAGY